MLYFVLVFALALRLHGALAFFPNSTTANPPRPAVTKAPSGNCSDNCVYSRQLFRSITWYQKPITATHTVETVLLIVNKSNSTRTTTISNTEIDFGKIATPTNLNNDGTVTTTVVGTDGSTHTVAYPTTVYDDYAPDITWTGTLSTTVDGIPACSTAPTGVMEVLPSHPPIPTGVQATGVNVTEDPRGWTFIPLNHRTCEDPRDLIENLFPELGVWNCQAAGPCETPFLGAVDKGLVALQTALYLTKTSISTEPDYGPTFTEAPVASTQSPAHIEKTAPVVTPMPVVSLSNMPSSTEIDSPEASPTKAHWGPPAPEVLSVAGQLARTTTATDNPAKESTSSTSPQDYNAPDALQPASDILLADSNPSVPMPKGIVITPSQALATALPTNPVGVLTPIISTDSKGTVTTFSSTAIAYPIIISSTNPQGNIILSTSLSTASVSLSLPTVISSTNAQGTVFSSTTHLPAIILTTTNAVNSKILTTSLLSLPTPPANTLAPIIINSETITPNKYSQYIISNQILTPGASITLGSGSSTTLLALQTSSDSTALVYGPRTSFLPPASGANPAPLTIGTETITPNSNSQYIISSSTLSADGPPITLGSGSSTTVLALQTSGSETALVYAASTSALTPIAPLPISPPAITIGTDTITANSMTQYIIGSQTLTAGGVVTVNGTRVSLAAGESDVVIGSSTEVLAPYITVGLGSGTNRTGGQVFEGCADKRWSGWAWGRKEMCLLWMVLLGWVMGFQEGFH